MLCKSTLLGMRLAMVCVVCYVVKEVKIHKNQSELQEIYSEVFKMAKI